MFEYVDKFKIGGIFTMTFTVKKLEAAEHEISELSAGQQELLKKHYELIENSGIEYVYVKHISRKLYEIKSNELRSLFIFQKDQIVLIGVVFVKQSKKTPKKFIKLAKTRLEVN